MKKSQVAKRLAQTYKKGKFGILLQDLLELSKVDVAYVSCLVYIELSKDSPGMAEMWLCYLKNMSSYKLPEM
jgi:hypothetical protein